MRDVNRIDKFCDELAEIWKENAADWRFGQLVLNVLGKMQSDGRDPFFPEEDEMIEYFSKYFNYDCEKFKRKFGSEKAKNLYEQIRDYRNIISN